eukprot:CAMPEP_0204869522 /NCGR_PEP_ID=MMETSP1348-20121228/29991_1 /ASSEMBLY_ACC=CAM_ASM_000700 /TAXON_ID=215587 /ORGANISM="Aplanochytrium stocchinoi, Strain GSBS06" /LENGTH=356 /DNA_ID=CAMNT_0052022929 /DNA_START=213 /DNA_END=1283 /DNA_ORIENTATION=-
MARSSKANSAALYLIVHLVATLTIFPLTSFGCTVSNSCNVCDCGCDAKCLSPNYCDHNWWRTDYWCTRCSPGAYKSGDKCKYCTSSCPAGQGLQGSCDGTNGNRWCVPTPAPTKYPTPHPTPHPSPFPTPQPTTFPTPYPTPEPSPFPTPKPTSFPTPNPTEFPSPQPTWACGNLGDMCGGTDFVGGTCCVHPYVCAPFNAEIDLCQQPPPSPKPTSFNGTDGDDDQGGDDTILGNSRDETGSMMIMIGAGAGCGSLLLILFVAYKRRGDKRRSQMKSFLENNIFEVVDDEEKTKAKHLSAVKHIGHYSNDDIDIDQIGRVSVDESSSPNPIYDGDSRKRIVSEVKDLVSQESSTV